MMLVITGNSTLFSMEKGFKEKTVSNIFLSKTYNYLL